MSKIFGEAKLDTILRKWYYIIQSDDGQIFKQSDAIFNSQIEAETELVELLKRLKNLQMNTTAKVSL